MNTRFLGNTGVRVSELCFGAMTFGGRGYWKNIGQVEQKEADALVGMALDGGINFFDTANVYSEGRVGGDPRQGPRQPPQGHRPRHQGQGAERAGSQRRRPVAEAHPRVVRREPQAARDRLGSTSTRSTASIRARRWRRRSRALDDLVRAGKVRYIGASNYAGWQLMKALAISDAQHLERFVTLQALYSLISRDLELELVPLSSTRSSGSCPGARWAAGS